MCVAHTNADVLAATRRELAIERRSLPIASAKQSLMENFEQNKTLVIVGETGSGKSTQVCLVLSVEQKKHLHWRCFDDTHTHTHMCFNI
jgi:HrpA-like RNA helicase